MTKPTKGLSFRDGLRFTWHLFAHPTHGDDVRYDKQTNVMSCSRCHRTWGGAK